MRNKSIGFKIGIVLAGFHLVLVLLAFFAYISSHSSTAGLAFILFFFLDAPLLLLPSAIFDVFGTIKPLVQFGVVGSAMWFLIPWLIDMVLAQIFRNKKQVIRAIIIIGIIPLILFGFFRLSRISMKLLIQRQRPTELKKVLNKASSDFLAEKVVFDGKGSAFVNSINRINCGDDNIELVVALSGYWCGVVFLDENYKEQSRLKLVSSTGGGFNTIEPLMDDVNSCKFLAYSYSTGVYLFDIEGKEIWKLTNSDTSTAHIDGVDFGDIDGNGKIEFTVYYSYGEGIHLLDGDGKTKWQHPVNALGHLEIIDIDGDGKLEIIYTNSNNAYGNTKFNILDSAGTIVGKLEVDTKSYEFSVIRWPDRKAKPHILLTEENKIRIIDFNGNDIIQLDAPGCRTYGKVKAMTVKLNKDEPEYLAVIKSLHPDILVLYVYDYKGNLVYQKTKVIGGGRTSSSMVLPMNEIGEEKLLVGSALDDKGVMLEYSLDR